MVKLESKRLFLRIIDRGDESAIFAYRSIPAIYQYQLWKPSTIADVADLFINKCAKEPNIPNTWMQLAICTKDDLAIIGDCGIHFRENEPEQVEIGITIGTEHQGNGYGSEALKAVFTYIFNELGKHRIIASIDPANTAAIKLVEKVKMRKEAHFRKSLRLGDEWVDDVIYALLAEEWKTND